MDRHSDDMISGAVDEEESRGCSSNAVKASVSPPLDRTRDEFEEDDQRCHSNVLLCMGNRLKDICKEADRSRNDVDVNDDDDNDDDDVNDENLSNAGDGEGMVKNEGRNDEKKTVINDCGLETSKTDTISMMITSTSTSPILTTAGGSPQPTDHQEYLMIHHNPTNNRQQLCDQVINILEQNNSANNKNHNNNNNDNNIANYSDNVDDDEALEEKEDSNSRGEKENGHQQPAWAADFSDGGGGNGELLPKEKELLVGVEKKRIRFDQQCHREKGWKELMGNGGAHIGNDVDDDEDSGGGSDAEPGDAGDADGECKNHRMIEENEHVETERKLNIVEDAVKDQNYNVGGYEDDDRRDAGEAGDEVEHTRIKQQQQQHTEGEEIVVVVGLKNYIETTPDDDDDDDDDDDVGGHTIIKSSNNHYRSKCTTSKNVNSPPDANNCSRNSKEKEGCPKSCNSQAYLINTTTITSKFFQHHVLAHLNKSSDGEKVQSRPVDVKKHLNGGVGSSSRDGITRQEQEEDDDDDSDSGLSSTTPPMHAIPRKSNNRFDSETVITSTAGSVTTPQRRSCNSGRKVGGHVNMNLKTNLKLDSPKNLSKLIEKLSEQAAVYGSNMLDFAESSFKLKGGALDSAKSESSCPLEEVASSSGTFTKPQMASDGKNTEPGKESLAMELIRSEKASDVAAEASTNYLDTGSSSSSLRPSIQQSIQSAAAVAFERPSNEPQNFDADDPDTWADCEEGDESEEVCTCRQYSDEEMADEDDFMSAPDSDWADITSQDGMNRSNTSVGNCTPADSIPGRKRKNSEPSHTAHTQSTAPPKLLRLIEKHSKQFGDTSQHRGGGLRSPRTPTSSLVGPFAGQTPTTPTSSTGGSGALQLYERASRSTPRSVPGSATILSRDPPTLEMSLWLGQFQKWLQTDRIMALNHIIDLCEPSQVRHIMKVIEPQFQRDFISLLPRELALQVLSYLEPKDLLRAAQTCKNWRFLCDDNLLWKDKYKQTSVAVEDETDRPRRGRAGNMPRISSPWKAAFMRQHIIEMNWRSRPIREPKILKGHDDHVITCLQFYGNRIVSGSDDNTLKVWSAVTGKCLRVLSGHTGGVWSSQMSSKYIISGSTDRSLKVWNAVTGLLEHTLVGHTSTVRCMHLHGDKVVSGSRDATLRVWDVNVGKCLHLLVGHLAAVRCVQYDGKLVVSGAYDYTVKVWNPENQECLHTLQGHTNRVYSLQFDGIHVVSGSLDTSIRVWDAETGSCKHTLMGHQSLTSGMELRDHILVSGNADSTVKIWDIISGQCLQTLSGPNKHQSAVTCLQFNSRFVITSSDDGTVKLWDVKTGEFIRNLVALDSGGSGGVVWRIRANDTKLICAVGSRNGTEDTKLMVLDFDVEGACLKCS